MDFAARVDGLLLNSPWVNAGRKAAAHRPMNMAVARATMLMGKM